MERVQCGLILDAGELWPLIVQIDSVACLKMFGWTLLISLLIDKEIRMGWPWFGHGAKGCLC